MQITVTGGEMTEKEQQEYVKYVKKNNQGNRMKKSKKFVKNDGTEKIIIKRTTKTFCLHAYLNRSKSLI